MGRLTGQLSRRTSEEEVAVVTFSAENAGDLEKQFDAVGKVLARRLGKNNAEVLDATETLQQKVRLAKDQIRREYAKELVQAGVLPAAFADPELLVVKEANGADGPDGRPDVRPDP